MNSAKQTFGICSIQSLLRETRQYKGRVDGVFGQSCYNAFERVVGEKVDQRDDFDAKTLFFNLQRSLARTGADIGQFDGVWGSKSQKAFEQLVDAYQRKRGHFGYGYAWTGHRRVTQSGIEKIAAWLQRHNKPDSHVSYLLSYISFETSNMFYYDPNNPDALHFDIELENIFKFFEEHNCIAKCNRLEDYYLSVVYPNAVGEDLDAVTRRKGIDDINSKGYCTIADVARPIVSRYWMGMDPINRKKISLS